MNGTHTFVALTVASALGLASAALANDNFSDRPHEGGAVVPCSLNGINPAYHPEVFGNPTTAASFGFVRSADGAWHVRPGCRH
jgi:hypothetical protein